MNENEILEHLKKQDERLEQIYRSIEKMRRYFLWTLIISLLVIVLPLIGLTFVVPQFLDIIQTGYGI